MVGESRTILGARDPLVTPFPCNPGFAVALPASGKVGNHAKEVVVSFPADAMRACPWTVVTLGATSTYSTAQIRE